jgi:hypothetical protein
MCQIVHLHGFEVFPTFRRDCVGTPLTELGTVITPRNESLPKDGVESQELVSFHDVPGGGGE